MLIPAYTPRVPSLAPTSLLFSLPGSRLDPVSPSFALSASPATTFLDPLSVSPTPKMRYFNAILAVLLVVAHGMFVL